ncbi:hypothetical protein D1007_34163 [Hordeum vulgare]|nr:hypothetical protein D1007_34163 [Hordeum vulgare]
MRTVVAVACSSQAGVRTVARDTRTQRDTLRAAAPRAAIDGVATSGESGRRHTQPCHPAHGMAVQPRRLPSMARRHWTRPSCSCSSSPADEQWTRSMAGAPAPCTCPHLRRCPASTFWRAKPSDKIAWGHDSIPAAPLRPYSPHRWNLLSRLRPPSFTLAQPRRSRPTTTRTSTRPSASWPPPLQRRAAAAHRRPAALPARELEPSSARTRKEPLQWRRAWHPPSRRLVRRVIARLEFFPSSVCGPPTVGAFEEERGWSPSGLGHVD